MTDLNARAVELRQRPDDPRACAELAEVTAKLGDYASAIDHDARAWALSPTDSRPILHILGILVDSGKWLGALTAFELVRDNARGHTALALDLAATQVLRQITGVFPPRGARVEADQMIDRLVEGCRTYPVANQIAVARTVIDLGRTAEATRLIERIEAIDAADLSHVCFLRGVICERGGDVEGASSLYEQAIAHDPHCTEAALNLMTILLESSEREANTRIAALLELLDPATRDVPAVRFNEALYSRRIGDHDRATALLSSIAADRTTELGRMARQVLASC